MQRAFSVSFRRKVEFLFYISLTVHLGTVRVNNQLDALF